MCLKFRVHMATVDCVMASRNYARSTVDNTARSRSDQVVSFPNEIADALSVCSCRTSQFDDRQMSPPSMKTDGEFQLHPGFAFHQCPGSGAGSTARPLPARFESRLPIGWALPPIQLVGRAASKATMRPVLIDPLPNPKEFLTEDSSGQWNDQTRAAQLLDRKNGTFQHRQSTVLADRAIARTNSLVPTPSLKPRAVELHTAITDDVLGNSGTCHGPTQHRAQLLRGRWALERSKDHDPSRKMIENCGHPPAERPPLWHCPRQPCGPESTHRCHQCQIHVPNMVRIFGGYRATLSGSCRWRAPSRNRARFAAQTCVARW